MRVIMVYKYLLDITAFILLFLIYLFILSGYGLINPRIVERYSLGLINYRVAVALHLNPILRLALIISSSIHGLTGFTLLSHRIRNRIYRKTTIVFIHVLFTSMTIYFLLLELLT